MTSFYSLVRLLDGLPADPYSCIQCRLLHLGQQGQGGEDPAEVHHDPAEISQIQTVIHSCQYQVFRSNVAHISDKAGLGDFFCQQEGKMTGNKIGDILCYKM